MNDDETRIAVLICGLYIIANASYWVYMAYEDMKYYDENLDFKSFLFGDIIDDFKNILNKKEPLKKEITSLEPMIYEPGTRLVAQNIVLSSNDEVIDVPKGYELLKTEHISGDNYRYTWINNKTIVVNGTYNYKTNEFIYETYGTVADEKVKSLN